VHPFILFGHGAVDPDSVDKNAEAFVCFRRDTTAEERRAIQDACPAAISGLFVWSDRFAYFGSGGDTFDFDVIQEFSEQAEDLVEAGDYEGVLALKPEAVDAFAEEYDRWLLDAHARVPIAFASMPVRADADDWGGWSDAQVDDALAALRQAAEAQPSLLAGGEDSSAGKDNRAAECFGWILGAVLGKLEDAPADPARAAGRAEAVALWYRIAAIELPLERLSMSEDLLHRQGSALAAALSAVSDPRARAARIAALDPYARLAYLASYAALDAADATRADVLQTVDAALRDAPAGQAAQMTALTSFLADNLVHETPAFDEPEPKNAPLALELYRRVVARGGPSVTGETYARAADAAGWAGDAKAALAFAESAFGLSLDPEVADRGAEIAREAGDSAAAARFAERARGVRAGSLATRKAMGQLKKGRIRDAIAMLEEHLGGGGMPTTEVLGNLALLYAKELPAKDVSERFLADLAERIRSQPVYGSEPSVVLNFCILAGNSGAFALGLDTVEHALDRGLPFDGQLAISYSYIGTTAPDPAVKRRVAAQIAARLRDDAIGEPLAFENLAEIHAALGDVPRAIDLVRRARDAGHEAFDGLRESPPLKALWKEPAFIALFEVDGDGGDDEGFDDDDFDDEDEDDLDDEGED
jgi:hypothetical protein